MPYQNPLQNCLFCFKQVYFLPVICIAKGWEPKARVSVQLRLAFGPLDGAFQALAEEALERKDRGDGRESRGEPCCLCAPLHRLRRQYSVVYHEDQTQGPAFSFSICK